MRAQPAQPMLPCSGAPLISVSQPQPGPLRRKARRKPTAVMALLAVLADAAPALAEPPELQLPLACTLGKDCFIEDYVDADPGPGQSDYACGIKSRNGHRGTNFSLPNFIAMETGVAVLAAAPGTIAATRDGVEDRAVTAANRDAIRGRECGNAVRIDHGGGWQTLYCHMRNGSVSVAKGDQVDAGDTLGLVGLSGLTNYPSLHISVLRDGQAVDPFRPDATAACGITQQGGLWADPPAYDRAGLFTAGFSDRVPNFAEVKSGAARITATTGNTPLVLYAHVFYAEPGDVLILSAAGPAGEVFSTEIPLEDPKKQLFRAYGRKAPPGGWDAGNYRGYVRLMRGETLLAVRHADIRVKK